MKATPSSYLLEYNRFIKVLCDYFDKNKLKGGVLQAGVSGRGFQKVSRAARTERKECKKANQKPPSKNKTQLTYDTLVDGHVIKVKDAKDYNGRFKNDINVDGVNSLDLGQSSIRTSTRPQKYSKPPYSACVKYGQNKNVFDEFGVDCDRCVIVKGCYKTNKHIIQRQLIPEDASCDAIEFPTVENVKIYERAVKTLFRKTQRIGILDAPNFDDVLNTEVSPAKKPGFRYEEEYELKTKEDAVLVALEKASRRWSYASSKKVKRIKRKAISPSVYTIGARNKRDYTYDDGDLATSRVVHMPEFHNELTSAPWCDEFSERLKELAAGPIYLGNSILDWFRLERDINNSSYVFEGDWKRFDSKLYIKMITIALCIVRCYFPHNSEYVDKHFTMMYDTLAIKDYHLVRGKVVRSYHGLPSGVKSTAIINSIINLLALIFIVGDEYSKDFNFIVGGDDFLVVSKSGRLESDRLIERFEKLSGFVGLELKLFKEKVHNSKRIEDCPVFYKYTIYKGMPVVPTSSALERVFMPWNRNYGSDIKMREFLLDVMPSLGTPMSHLYLYYDYLSK